MPHRLGPEDVFAFQCRSELPCWTTCCSNLDLLLTPYDLIRLSRRLGLTPAQFRERWTESPWGERARLPWLFLRMNDDANRSCPFLSAAGCSVYSDRPWVCRLYPLALKSAGEGTGQFELVVEPHCHGHQANRKWTVRAWQKDQFPERDWELGLRFAEICFPSAAAPGSGLDSETKALFFAACYDSEQFCHRLSPAPPSDPVAQIRLALNWLQARLSASPTAEPKSPAGLNSEGL